MGSLGNLLRQLRLDRRMTQAQLALAVSIDHTYMSKIESDRARPSVKLLRAIASTLSVTHDEWLNVAFHADICEVCGARRPSENDAIHTYS